MDAVACRESKNLVSIHFFKRKQYTVLSGSGPGLQETAYRLPEGVLHADADGGREGYHHNRLLVRGSQRGLPHGRSASVWAFPRAN